MTQADVGAGAATRDRRGRASRWLALAILAVSLLAAAVVLVFQVSSGYQEFQAGFGVVTATGLGFAILGPLIVSRQPGNRIGWLACLLGLGFTAGNTVLFFAEYLVIVQGREAPLAPWLLWLSAWYLWGTVALLFVFLPLLFPNGRFLNRRWRRFGWLAAVLTTLTLLFIAFAPGPLIFVDSIDFLDNPLGINPPGLDLPPLGLLAARVFSVTILLVTLAAAGSLVLRWRRSRGDERQQIKWFAFFLASVVSFFVLLELTGGLLFPALFETALYDVALWLAWTGFPLVIGLAIFKYRLYDIDIIIRRTLVYGLLTALLLIVYFGSVIVLQQLFHSLTGQDSPLAIVISTLAIAALFQPLRRRLQALIDRRFYRRKYNAEQMLARFTATARDEVDLDRLLAEVENVVEETMQPAGLSIWLRRSEYEERVTRDA